MAATQNINRDPTEISTHNGYCPGCQKALGAMDDLIPADKEGRIYALCCPNCYYTLKRL